MLSHVKLFEVFEKELRQFEVQREYNPMQLLTLKLLTVTLAIKKIWVPKVFNKVNCNFYSNKYNFISKK